jgi:hypothetical protein
MSQVTKPIALDETLQDVVTAIQGITQGGMIVSTGNVGSATQPVYINGGVPTPGMNFAITTGTPTNVNTALSLNNESTIKKSGNVVSVHLVFDITGTLTLAAGTRLCKLPYASAITYAQLLRISGSTTTSATHSLGISYIDTGNYVCLGFGDYVNFESGKRISISGTYLTND